LSILDFRVSHSDSLIDAAQAEIVVAERLIRRKGNLGRNVGSGPIET